MFTRTLVEPQYASPMYVLGRWCRSHNWRFTISWSQPQQWGKQLTVYCRSALAGQSRGKGHFELVVCSHITLPIPPEKRTWVLKHSRKWILQLELVGRRTWVAGVASMTGARWWWYCVGSLPKCMQVWLGLLTWLSACLANNLECFFQCRQWLRASAWWV
jgi:hypothetical protein